MANTCLDIVLLSAWIATAQRRAIATHEPDFLSHEYLIIKSSAVVPKSPVG